MQAFKNDPANRIMAIYQRFDVDCKAEIASFLSIDRATGLSIMGCQNWFVCLLKRGLERNCQMLDSDRPNGWSRSFSFGNLMTLFLIHSSAIVDVYGGSLTCGRAQPMATSLRARSSTQPRVCSP